MPPQIVSHYRIISMLGEGGMGEVYLAEDLKLRRKVAIKFLPADSTLDRRARKRLLREAQAAARLDHPNICTVHEVVDETAASYIVMQYVEGETLYARLLRGKLTTEEALDIAVQIADALSEAHARGIVHRDIKPQNVMIMDGGRVKVLDFGVAKLAEERAPAGAEDETRRAETAALLTGQGVTVGTMPYMSPEQLRAERVDARSDIFSLGVVLYQLFSGGRHPFAATNSVGTISAILTREPEPLPLADAERGAGVENILRKCLAKSPDERYQSARELLEDLRSVRRGLAPASATAGVSATASVTAPVVATRPQNGLARFLRPAVAAALLLALAGTGAYLFARRDAATGEAVNPAAPRAISSVAVLPFANSGANPDAEFLSDGITESLIYSLSRLPNLRVIARTSAFSYKGKDVPPQQVGRELNVQAVLTGKVERHDDTLVISVDLADARDNRSIWGKKFSRKSSDILALQEDVAREISTNLRAELSGADDARLSKRHTGDAEAYQLYQKGRYYWNQLTPEGTRNAIKNYQLAIERDPAFALPHAGLADCYVLGSIIGLSPTEAMERARRSATEALRLDGELAEAHTSLAFVKSHYDWDWAGAEAAFRRAIALNPNYATAHYWYSDYLTAMGRFDDALNEIRLARELDPLSPGINSALGLPHYYAGQYDRAIEEFRKVAATDPDYTLIHRHLGWAYRRKGMFDEAVREFETAYGLSKHPNMLAELGYTYAVAGRRADAQRVLKELTEISRTRYVSSYYLALVHVGLGDRDRAFALLDKAFDERAGTLLYLKVTPSLDNLRTDPRFARLLQRMNFTP